MDDIKWQGYELISAVLGFIGAALGISYSEPMSKKQMFAALMAGIACGVFLPLLVSSLYALPKVVNNALCLLFGMGGMFIVPAVLSVWRGFAADPWGVFDRLRGMTRKDGGEK